MLNLWAFWIAPAAPFVIMGFIFIIIHLPDKKPTQELIDTMQDTSTWRSQNADKPPWAK
jgi:hypothetical protein